VFQNDLEVYLALMRSTSSGQTIIPNYDLVHDQDGAKPWECSNCIDLKRVMKLIPEDLTIEDCYVELTTEPEDCWMSVSLCVKKAIQEVRKANQR